VTLPAQRVTRHPRSRAILGATQRRAFASARRKSRGKGVATPLLTRAPREGIRCPPSPLLSARPFQVINRSGLDDDLACALLNRQAGTLDLIYLIEAGSFATPK
jgi:hypothetical protein